MMENEYARIMLEQGIIGLLIWIVFIIWLFTRREPNRRDSWYLGRRLAFVACAASFVTGLIGTGLLTSVPHSALLFLLVGWVGAQQPRTEEVEAVDGYVHAKPPAIAPQYGLSSYSSQRVGESSRSTIEGVASGRASDF
jgi:hypothetical protein